MHKKFPKAYIVTEILDDDTGNVIQRKTFGEPHGITIDQIKGMRQEYVSLIKHSLKYYEETVVAESISPDDVSKYMISAVDEDGFGTEWVYTIRHCPFVESIEAPFVIPKHLRMTVN